MVDGSYIISLLGCANLIELTLLAGGFIAVCISSTGNVQLENSSPNIIKNNITQPSTDDAISFYNIDVYTIKQATQAIFMIIFLLTLFSFLTHIIFAFRYRYAWHRLSISIAFLCVIYTFALFIVSVLVACWEDKIRKRLNSTFLNNHSIPMLNASGQTQTGSAAAAATFGFAACLIYLSEALIRFRRLADKIQS